MSLDPSVRPKLARIIRQWLSENKMFSAFEVSLAAKDNGVRARHRDLRDTVHEVIAEVAEDFAYSRTLMDVGAPVQAWVYHPLTGNPYLYTPLPREGEAPPPPLAVPDIAFRNPRQLRAGAAMPASSSDGAYGLDRFGQLKIPADMLQALGRKAGDAVHLRIDSANSLLRLHPPRTALMGAPDHELRVDAEGTVSLNTALLSEVEIDGLQCYLIHRDGSDIVVEAWPSN